MYMYVIIIHLAGVQFPARGGVVARCCENFTLESAN